MEKWKSFKVETVVQGLDFRYTPSVEVFAKNGESAKEKAVALVSRNMLVNRSLVKVTNII